MDYGLLSLPALNNYLLTPQVGSISEPTQRLHTNIVCCFADHLLFTKFLTNH